MKKIIVIGICFALLIIVSLLFLQHSRHPSDTEIRQKVSGSWTGKNHWFVMTITPDGSYAFGTSPSYNSVSGTWQIQDGFFITTVTNSTAHGGSPLIGSVLRCKIIHFDDHEFTFDIGGGETMTLKR